MVWSQVLVKRKLFGLLSSIPAYPEEKGISIDMFVFFLHCPVVSAGHKEGTGLGTGAKGGVVAAPIVPMAQDTYAGWVAQVGEIQSSSLPPWR